MARNQSSSNHTRSVWWMWVCDTMHRRENIYGEYCRLVYYMIGWFRKASMKQEAFLWVASCCCRRSLLIGTN